MGCCRFLTREKVKAYSLRLGAPAVLKKSPDRGPCFHTETCLLLLPHVAGTAVIERGDGGNRGLDAVPPTHTS